MKLINKKLGNVAIKVPKLLFPKASVDLQKWAVIACDQYTSNDDYWEQVSKKVGTSPSTYKLMLPEVFLESSSESKMLKKISYEMKKYLRYGTLKPLTDGFMYVERVTSYGNERKGLVTCIDLEMYNYDQQSKSLIRPTEKTILDRIPPRVKIRENAVIELPHVMLLIDDEKKTVIEPFAAMNNSYKKLYNFDLMMNGGHIEGYHIDSIQDMEHISKSLHDLVDDAFYQKKYQNNENKILFAVGDGNHSLASAKYHWENIKKTIGATDMLDHPARYALVEIVNIHDEHLLFEPIHRVLFNTDYNLFLEHLTNHNVSIKEVSSADEMDEQVKVNTFANKAHVFGLINNNTYKVITINETTSFTACGSIQCIIDEFIEKQKVAIDFIHDKDSLINISTDKNIGFLLPPIDKSSFFKTIIEEGTMPRKTFSMGHADEKRFYLETRKITL